MRFGRVVGVGVGGRGVRGGIVGGGCVGWRVGGVVVRWRLGVGRNRDVVYTSTETTEGEVGQDSLQHEKRNTQVGSGAPNIFTPNNQSFT